MGRKRNPGSVTVASMHRTKPPPQTDLSMDQTVTKILHSLKMRGFGNPDRPESIAWDKVRDEDLEIALTDAFGPCAAKCLRRQFKHGLMHLLGPVFEPRSFWPVFWASASDNGPVHRYIREWMRRSAVVRNLECFWQCSPSVQGQWDLWTVRGDVFLITIQFSEDRLGAFWDGRWPLRRGTTHGIYLRVHPSGGSTFGNGNAGLPFQRHAAAYRRWMGPRGGYQGA